MYDLNYDLACREIRAAAAPLSRAWFHRAWIVQELALSRNPFLVWADLESRQIVPWKWLEWTVLLLHQHFNSLGIFSGRNMQVVNKPLLIESLKLLMDAARFFRRINDIRLGIEGEMSLGLPLVLHAIRPFEASDVRDKVYAGFGTASHCDTVRIDYNISESELFISTTKAWLEETRDLSILGLCWPSNKSGLPLWAVDFTLKDIPAPLGSWWLVNGAQRLYSAGSHLSPRIRFEGRSTMVLRGVPLGVLFFVGGTEPVKRFLGEADGPIDIKELMAGVVQAPKDMSSVLALRQAWLGEWMGGQRWLGEKEDAPETYRWTQENVMDAFHRTLFADFHQDESDDVELLTRLGNDFEFTAESFRVLLLDTSQQTLNHRVFATSSLGHFCLVRENAKAGDVVFVPIEAEMPYLLRSINGEYYEIIGECYVNGFMDGEVLQYYGQEDVRLLGIEVFLL